MGDPGDSAEDQRLPGERESESSPHLEDAQHWMQVYTELLTFKHTLLRTAGDHAPIESELERLERRHRFWEQRVQLLQTG